METKNILKKTLKLLKESDTTFYGICYYLRKVLLLEFPSKDGVISEQHFEFMQWFDKQKPSETLEIHIEFTLDDSFYGGDYWWNRDHKGKEQRILFLEYLIKNS